MRRLVLIGLMGCHGAPAPLAAPPEPPRAVPTEHVHEGSRSLESIAQGASLLGDMGQLHREVGTRSAEAQAYFDQGLALAYGFNHDEAARSFAHAGEVDRDCALCFWGAAYTLGPNYNMPMLPDRARAAWEALERARAAAYGARPVEQALIEALGHRYAGPEYLDAAAMQPFNVAFADAMREVARSFPDDLDVQVLYAEALMNVNPWKLWTPLGEPAPGTSELMSVLEGVLVRAPEHVGANHFYIHAVEASRTPEKGVSMAERLPGLVPGAGHLAHMPAHIFQRVGRYADASAANRRAVEVDAAYLARVQVPGYYPFYTSHNYGFLAYSASMQGRAEESLAAARTSASTLPKDLVCGMPGMDFFLSEPLLVMVRFGRWQELLAQARPDPKYPVLRALDHHARGYALAATGDLEAAHGEADALARIASSLPELTAGMNNGRSVLELAHKIVEARIAEAEHDDHALPLWQEAVALEAGLAYNEPADWFTPTRHSLGALLLDLGDAREAEAVYRADLREHPHNGWALFGLHAALQVQHKREAVQVAKAFKAAWKDADITLTRSAF